MRTSETLDLLAPALQNFQRDVPIVPKTKTNPFFKSRYADLDECVKTAKSGLDNYGLAVSQFPSSVEGKPALTTILMHISGQWIADDAVLMMAKDDPQGQGGAITYMRRYAYCAVLGLVADEDDDGNAASQRSPSSNVDHGRTRETGGGTESGRSAPSPDLRTKSEENLQTLRNNLAQPKLNLRTEGQGRALYAISNAKDIDLRSFVAERFGVKRDDQLTFDEAKELIDEWNQK